MMDFLARLEGFRINHKIIILKESPPSIMVTRKPNGSREFR